VAKCEVHHRKKAVGYCHGCGLFGCEACLPAVDDHGRRYCRRCAERQHVPLPTVSPRGRNIEHRYIVRFKDGRRVGGTFYTIKLDGDGFNFVALSGRDGTGDRQVYIRFKDLKAVFQVKEWKGDVHHPPRYLTPDHSDHNEVAVYFSDGEVIRGHVTGHYGPHDKRFYLVPRDKDDNNQVIIVEASAVDRVQTRGVRRTRELRDLVSNAVRKRILTYYWRHRGSVVTLPEIAHRLERVESAIAQNLEPYIEHGLIERRSDEGHDVLHLMTPSDRATRDFLRASYEEIRRFYFHRDHAAQTETHPG